MILTKTHFFSITLIISAFSVINPASSSWQKSKATIVPMKTIFENGNTEVSGEAINAELNDLLTSITRCTKETTALLLRINNYDYTQLLKELLPGALPSKETQRAQKELLKKKEDLEDKLEKIINGYLLSFTELNTTKFTAKKLIALMHDPAFWDKKINDQINLVIEECIKK